MGFALLVYTVKRLFNKATDNATLIEGSITAMIYYYKTIQMAQIHNNN